MLRKTLSLLRSSVDIRQGEWLMTFLMSFNLFLVISTFAVVKPARSSLFLQQYGASKLPYVYLATALLAGLVAAIHGWLFRRFSPLRVQFLTYLFFITNLAFFWWAFQQEIPWLSAAFYLWVNIFTITLNTLFWILANHYYNPREAKRLYGVINSGGTIGGILSGFVVAQLVTSMGTENLLLLCAGVLGVAIVISSLIQWKGEERFAAREYSYVEGRAEAGGEAVAAEPGRKPGLFASTYPRYIAIALAFALVVSVIVEFQFNVVVERTYALKDAKTAFFSSFFAWINVLTFVLQFFLTSFLLRRLGIGVSLLILPVAMLLGSALFPLYPMLASAIFLRITDGSVRYSVEQSTRDVLYLPIPGRVMVRLKAFIDVFVQRAAKGVGSLVILAFTEWLVLGFELLSYITMSLAALWLVVAVLLRREYVNELRRFFRRGAFPREGRLIRHLDQRTRAELLARLESADEGQAVYSLELLEKADILDVRLVLRRWVGQGSPALQAQALRRLTEIGDDSVVTAAESILEQEPNEATGEAIHYLCRTSPKGPMAKMQEFLSMPNPRVRAAALACMFNHGGPEGQEQVRPTLQQMVRESGPEGTDSRMLVARTLAHIEPPSTLHSLLLPLLEDDSPEVVRLSLSATQRVLRRDLVPLIIRHLGTPGLARAASRALAAHGDGILGTLRDYLADDKISLRIRCKLPAVYAEVGSVKGVRDLVDALSEGEGNLRYAIAKALNRLRLTNPKVQIREEMVRSAIMMETAVAYRLLKDLQSYERDTPPDGSGRIASLREDLKRQFRRSLHRLFRLLALLFPQQDITNAYRGLRNSRVEVRAKAVELLDNLMPSNLSSWVLPLVDDSIPAEEKSRIGAKLARS